MRPSGPPVASGATRGRCCAGWRSCARPRNVGLTLEEIGAELDLLPDGRTPTPADWRRISDDWRARLDEQIAAVEALRDRLDGCIGCGCLSLDRCSLYNPDDALAEQGPGARRLPERLRRPQPPRRLPDAARDPG